MKRHDIVGAEPPAWEVGPAGGQNALGQTQTSRIALNLGAGMVGGVAEIRRPSSGAGVAIEEPAIRANRNGPGRRRMGRGDASLI